MIGGYSPPVRAGDCWELAQKRAVRIIKLRAALRAAEHREAELREFVTAHTLVEKGVIDFDLHGEAVERLRRASELPAVNEVIRAALGGGEET